MLLSVSRSSYYTWEKRPKSRRAKENKILLQKIKDIHNESNKVYGSTKITRKLNTKEKDKVKVHVNHKRVERLMSEIMTKDPVITALESAYLRAEKPTGAILRSDGGSQYCSMDY